MLTIENALKTVVSIRLYQFFLYAIFVQWNILPFCTYKLYPIPFPYNKRVIYSILGQKLVKLSRDDVFGDINILGYAIKLLGKTKSAGGMIKGLSPPIYEFR